MINKDFFIKQLDDIVKEYKVIKNKSKYSDLSDVADEELMTALTKSKAAIARITGKESEYYKDVEDTIKKIHIHEGSKLNLVVGITTALKSDLENDYLRSFRHIIQAEVFSDYLEMADYLLSEAYHIPAAVIGGSTLEEHLRKLCQKNNLPIDHTDGKGKIQPKAANDLNQELYKGSIYNKIESGLVEGWIKIRNAAAHGKHSEYTSDQVKHMLQGVKEFIARNPL